MTAEVIPPRGTEWEWLIEPPESCPCGDDDPEGCMNLNFGYVYGRLMPHGPIPGKPKPRFARGGPIPGYGPPLAPAEIIDTPERAEQLGLTADARRMRREQAQRNTDSTQ